MKSKKLKILILILVIILVILIISLKILNANKKNIEEAKENNPELFTMLDIYDINSVDEFFTVNSCIRKFLLVYNDKETLKALSMLDENYKKKYNISDENIYENINILEDKYTNFFAEKISMKEISVGQIYKYFVYGKIYEKNYSKVEEVYIIANLDYLNNTFSVEFNESANVSKEEYIKIIEGLKKENTGELIEANHLKENEIKLNEYNTFQNITTNIPRELEEYAKHYSIMAVYFPEYAYNELLNKEYRDAKFDNLEQFKEYIKRNKNLILNGTITDYSYMEKDGEEEYFIKDTSENYYIFEIRGIMDYSVIMDFYTIDLEQIIQKYDNGSEKEKVAINIQKMFAAIKDKDYEYAYSKLSDNFKKNNYQTIEKFEETIKTIYTGKMSLTLEDFSNEGNTYIYNISLKGTTASNNKIINMQIIMQLKENRDFVMSFSIK